MTESRAVSLEQTRLLRRADPALRASIVCPTVAPDQGGSRSLLFHDAVWCHPNGKRSGRVVPRQEVLTVLGHGRKAMARVRICSGIWSATSEASAIFKRLTSRVPHALGCRRVQSPGFVVEGTELDDAVGSETEAAKETAEGRRTWGKGGMEVSVDRDERSLRRRKENALTDDFDRQRPQSRRRRNQSAHLPVRRPQSCGTTVPP